MRMSYIVSGSRELLVRAVKEDLTDPYLNRRIEIRCGDDLNLYLRMEDYPAFMQAMKQAQSTLANGNTL